MERLVNEIRPGFVDELIDSVLAAGAVNSHRSYTKHFNQNEEYFLKLSLPYRVPSFPIHHDIRLNQPEMAYLEALREWFKNFMTTAPAFFSNLHYFFDPGEILKPCLYRLYRIADELFLFLLRVDLSYRPLEANCLTSGTNDTTAAFTTDRLYLEADLIPLETAKTVKSKIQSFTIRQTISQTWIGESGKGYLVRGIWMDSELNKYFSKLFLPAGKRHYPYYPFTCKYKTVCMTVLDPDSHWNQRFLPYLQKALEYLLPAIPMIQEELRAQSFSETLPSFQKLKASLPSQFFKAWDSLQLQAYLNEHDQKEYLVEL